MWRYDAGRTASSPERLPTDLRLLWTRDLPTPRPAWPRSQPKLHFDLSYEPVVMGKTLFVPSMATDSVTAYSTDTGAQNWRFYADGPVRLAPVAANGRLYFVADDGYLYCLRAADGMLLWRFRGGPSDRRLLGNDRLIGMWPARGGPVLYNNKVYFTSGMWPFLGVFVHAVEAETGRVVWTNSGSGSTYLKQPHNSPAFAGVAPQGYLTATPERLLIPGGRSVPAGYDRASGRFLYYHLASRQFGKDGGGYGTSAVGSVFFGGGAAYDLAGGDGIARLGKGVYTAHAAYFCRDGKVQAVRIAPTPGKSVDRRGKQTAKPAFKSLGQLAFQPAPERVFLKAGPHLLVACANDTIAALDVHSWEKRRRAAEPDAKDELGLEDDPQPADGPADNVSWRTKISGRPTTMLAADRKLFVVTDQGRIHCFGGEERPVKRYPAPPSPPAPEQDEWTDAARKMIRAAGVDAGYCLVLGGGSGRLAEELWRQSRLHVIVVEPDPAKVEALRDRLYLCDDLARTDSAKALAPVVRPQGSFPPPRRLFVHQGDPLAFPAPPYMASLIVSEDFAALGFNRKEAKAEGLYAPLRPYGGVACLAVPPAQRERFTAWLRAAALADAEITQAGNLTLLRRPGALPGAASWTHQYASAANPVVSTDKRVKAPLGMLWFGGPPNDEVLPRHGHGPSPQVVGGRLFLEGANMLRCVDVYTGRLLWQRQFPGIGKYFDITKHFPGANEIGSNYVSMADGVYLMSPRSCLRLDPASGETLKEFSLPPAGAGEMPNWGFVTVWDNLLVAGSAPVKVPLGLLVGGRTKWRYLAGSHPQGPWTGAASAAKGWQSGRAGFGYGSEGVSTSLAKMRGNYTAVYLQTSFLVTDPAAIRSLELAVRSSGGVIAYLNGKEVARRRVAKGAGASASGVSRRDDAEVEFIGIDNPAGLLREGANVLAIEGHSAEIGADSFFLSAQLNSLRHSLTRDGKVIPPAPGAIPGAGTALEYAPASRRLTAMDRYTGAVAWSRPAAFSFRHNAVVLGGDKLFCIDALPKPKADFLRRRGLAPPSRPTLYGIAARTGKVIWETDKDVFGTWLGYSAEHDILLQAGSRARDRARDEVDRGMVAYRASDGKVLWRDLDRRYSGPCLLHHEAIITQGGAFELLTGKPRTRPHPLTGEPVPWSFTRNYGCNTAIGSEYLLTFRSAAAGYFDLERGGTGNFGGFKSGCTSNLVAADGVLNAPDYTRTCSCAYQNQCSVALIHDPEAEVWTFNALPPWQGPLHRLGVNFGAPGDRIDDDGVLWLEYPLVGGPSPPLGVVVEPAGCRSFRRHSSVLTGGGSRWVAASGLEGVRKITVPVQAPAEEGEAAPKPPPHPYTVRLHFAENGDAKPGERVFDVRLQGKPVLTGFDVAKAAGGAARPVTREFHGVTIGAALRVEFAPQRGEPVICGIELKRE